MVLTNNYKRNLLFTLLAGLFLTFFIPMTAQAKDVYGERYTGSYDVNNPLTWNQCSHAYSNDTYPVWGESYCASSCGAHSLTWMFLKSGVWDMSKSPKDAFTFFNKNGWASKGSGGYNSMGIGAPVTENGKTVKAVKYVSGDMATFKTWAKDMYNQGYYMIVNVPGHLIGVDYVDEDGDVVVLDSADLCKYIECAVERWGNSITAWAYEIEGSKSNASSSINFWTGGKVTGKAGNTSQQETGGSFSELNDEWTNPMLEYDNNAVHTRDKGLNVNEERGWFSWMFR